MKRQHPTDPNLFWCPKCQTYKARALFGSHISRAGSVAPYCKDCCKNITKTNTYIKSHAKASKKYRDVNKEVCSQRTCKWQSDNREIINKRYITDMADGYIKHCLRARTHQLTPEIIELKRQQITAKRTLKQFQEWRKENENESNHTDVHGKQCADEETHEGVGIGGDEAGFGNYCGSATGI